MSAPNPARPSSVAAANPSAAIPASPAPEWAARFAAPAGGACRLPMLGVLRASGADAAQFLQSQLTQDVLHMPPGPGARLAAFCTPKGRMLASFHVFRPLADQVLLVCERALLPGLLKRLSRFVMRAKVKLDDASAELACWGLLGEAAVQAAQAVQADAGGLPLLADLPPAGGQPCALWLAAADAPAPAGAADLPVAHWLAAEALAGVARVGEATAEAFVPQMLNYESMGGVHFKKGCYPGQEVVARSQFRGVIKRRAFVGWADGIVQAGQEVFAEGQEQPMGLIAQAAAAPEGGGCLVIAGLQIAAALGQPPLHVGAADGPTLHGLHIPYPLADDI